MECIQNARNAQWNAQWNVFKHRHKQPELKFNHIFLVVTNRDFYCNQKQPKINGDKNLLKNNGHNKKKWSNKEWNSLEHEVRKFGRHKGKYHKKNYYAAQKKV